MNIGRKSWAVIVNPHSGKKSVRREWKHIQQIFQMLNIPAVFAFSSETGNSITLTKEFITEGYKNIAVIGGDGTLNEVLNGIMQSSKVRPENITLSIIPNGTGNDWARYWNISEDYEQSIALLKNGTTTMTDIGVCSYKDEKSQDQTRYFINTAGLGFEIKVLKNASVVKNMWKGKRWMYSFSVIFSALVSISHSMSICANGIHKTLKIFTLNIGNGCYSGGGLRQTPMASPTDGALDITIVKRLSFKNLLLGIKYLFKGKLLLHPCVKTIRTTKFQVMAAERSTIELDGIIIKSKCPIEFSILPQKIQMVIPCKN